MKPQTQIKIENTDEKSIEIKVESKKEDLGSLLGGFTRNCEGF